MTKPFEVHECKYGVEIHYNSDTPACPGSIARIMYKELLTVEEAEDLAHQLLDAARESRMNAEDICPHGCPKGPGECVYCNPKNAEDYDE